MAGLADFNIDIFASQWFPIHSSSEPTGFVSVTLLSTQCNGYRKPVGSDDAIHHVSHVYEERSVSETLGQQRCHIERPAKIIQICGDTYNAMYWISLT